MKIYKKCPCCGKIMFLLLGSDFGNEVELGSAFGKSDNIPHNDSNHEEDWTSLANFLTSLKASHGEVFISLKGKEKDNFPKEMLPWTENYQKETAKPSKDWKNIHRDFTHEEYKERWIKVGFTYEQTADWINIGMDILDHVFCAWLRDVKKKDPAWVLNHGNDKELRREFEEVDDLYS